MFIRIPTVNPALSKKKLPVKEMEEKPAGVVGATFFGGNKQKEELFDPGRRSKCQC
jgi:hypothetical protein